MAGLGEIVVDVRVDNTNNLGPQDEKDSIDKGSTKHKRSRRRRNSRGSEGSAQASQTGQTHEEREKEHDKPSGRSALQQTDGGKRAAFPTKDDHQTRFYENYRKVAGDYDKEYLEKYGEELDTTLIFAGLFSAVASAFIVLVDTQLHSDPNAGTEYLLRVLIYNINNTALGNEPPTLPQWSPPRTLVQVQAILFASLAASLLSAFLAMLGKQWLRRYASTDKRTSAIERSRNRQRKWDGIVAWGFDPVMESLPLMLQTALLLLGCALARYLWDVDITLAAVLISVTGFGFCFYVFFVIAGAISESCPYQTPGSHFLRSTGKNIPRRLHSSASNLKNAITNSNVGLRVAYLCGKYSPWWSKSKIGPFLWSLVTNIPSCLVTDIGSLMAALASRIRSHVRGIYDRSWGALSQPQGPDWQAMKSDLQCISWTLQTSLEKSIRLAALKHLIMISDLPVFDPTLITNCYNVFIGSVDLSHQRVVIVQGLEDLATLSVQCFFHTLHHLSLADPMSDTFMHLCRHYTSRFPAATDFRGLPFYHTMTKIFPMVHPDWTKKDITWADYKPSSQEHVPFARHMVEAAQTEYLQLGNKKVPRWILRFALHSLSLDPAPPVSVIADCLVIIAIDLDCDISEIANLDESDRAEQISNAIVQKLQSIVESANPGQVLAKKYKAISALFHYAVHLERSGKQGMLAAVLRASNMPNPTYGRYVWYYIGRYAVAMIDNLDSPSIYQAIMVVAPYIRWNQNHEQAVIRWASAASTIPYSEEIGRSVVDVLLQIAYKDYLRGLIPTDIWALLKKLPSLPLVCTGRSLGSHGKIVGHVRGLGDFEILKSYFLLIFSEWSTITPTGLQEIEISFREDFGGTEMWQHRADLVGRLEHVLEQLDLGLDYFRQHIPGTSENELKDRKEKYGKLRGVLVEVHGNR